MSHRRFVPAVLLFLLAFPGDVVAQEPLTVDAALAYSMPSSMVASTMGREVAWVLNERGARNIWVAEAPRYEGRRLTAYADDDGQALGSMQFAAAGRTVIYVRGGAPNSAGELPNPLSVAAGVKRQIWAIDLDGGEPRLVAEGSSPLVAPSGDALVYRGAGGLYHIAVPAAGEEAGETRLVAAPRGGIGAVRWSPSGEHLLFASNRGTHSYIGIVGLNGGEISWIDPTVDSDGSPVWSPDGSQIAFVRVPARRDFAIFAPVREARPWSIRVADVATGASHEIFVAEPGAGSVPVGVGAPNRPNSSTSLIWAAGDRLIFPWERNGWAGLYSVPVAGGAPVVLAVGEFEVETVGVSVDASELLVVSNQDDIDRRHVWRLPVDGSSPAARISSGEWIEWAPTFGAEGSIAYLRSSATEPAHAATLPGVGDARAMRVGAAGSEYPSDQLVEPQQVVFTGADGMPIHGQLFLPADLKPGERRPAVLFFHGGSRRQMLLGFHYIGYYHNAYALNQVLASRGYIVLAVNYRSGIGYGTEFREALDYGASGASEFNDVLGAGLYLRGRDDVEPGSIGLWGGSYGGYLTALGLARASDLFAAGVDLHGVHDWNEGIRIFVPSYVPDEEAERLAFESSPNASLDTWRSPVLLIHGDDDRNVFFSQTVYLVEQLRDRDVHVEQLVFPDEVHGFLLHRSWVRAYEATVDFFDRTLRARQ